MFEAALTAFDHTAFLKQTTQAPGIYQMFALDGKILYVGKAKNLKKRLASYFRSTGLAPKTKALVSRIHSIELTVTRTEIEALLLEQNLIKALKPPFNILLRDDKSYPFLHFSDHTWPALSIIDKVREIMRVAQEPVSLETPIGEEEDSHLGDFIPDDDAPAPVDEIGRAHV